MAKWLRQVSFNDSLLSVYSGVPNNRVDRLVCGKPFSHWRQTYLEWFSVSKCVGWDKKDCLPFAVWPFVVDLLYLKSNEISAKCIYSASKYKSFSFFKTYTGGRQQQLSRGKLTQGSRQWRRHSILLGFPRPVYCAHRLVAIYNVVIYSNEDL